MEKQKITIKNRYSGTTVNLIAGVQRNNAGHIVGYAISKRQANKIDAINGNYTVPHDNSDGMVLIAVY